MPLLCAAGADPNAAAEKGSALPLWWATRFGYYGVMSALLEAGADVDGVSSGRGRPLALAAGLGDADALRLLLAADADADADMGAALRRAAGGKVRRVWFQPPKSGVTKFDWANHPFDLTFPPRNAGKSFVTLWADVPPPWKHEG